MARRPDQPQETVTSSAKPSAAISAGSVTRVLVVATKTPWPRSDGGRRVLWDELSALSDCGVCTTLVAPCDPDLIEDAKTALQNVCAEVVLVPLNPATDPRRPRWKTLLRPEILRLPFTAVRFLDPSVTHHVEELLQRSTFDTIHCEQLQALSLLPRSLWTADVSSRTAVVLRGQNVESDLWWALADALQPSLRNRLLAAALRWEARRLQRYEVRSSSAVSRCLAITDQDRQRLIALGAPATSLATVRAPFPDRLPGREQPLEGDPALVLVVGEGWLPNRLAARAFLADVWPAIAAARPGAILHCFGSMQAASGDDEVASEQVVFHEPTERSRDLFDPTAILVVPLEVASGVRIKILDAWARGMPVICSPVAARGLDGAADVSHLEASTPQQWVDAVGDLETEQRRRQLIDAGRSVLRRHYDRRTVATRLIDEYRSASATARQRSTGSTTPSHTTS